MLSAIRKLAMTHRSISLPDLPAVRTLVGIPSCNGRDEKQIGRTQEARRFKGQQLFIGLPSLLYQTYKQHQLISRSSVLAQLFKQYGCRWTRVDGLSLLSNPGENIS